MLRKHRVSQSRNDKRRAREKATGENESIKITLTIILKSQRQACDSHFSSRTT